MWLSWTAAVLITCGLAVVTLVARRVRHPWARGVTTSTQEAAIILALYAFWQKGSDIAVTHAAGAVGHALWVSDAERAMHLPREAAVQRLVLPHPLLVEALNQFYAIVHVPALIVVPRLDVRAPPRPVPPLAQHRRVHDRGVAAHPDDPGRSSAPPAFARVLSTRP